MDALWHDLRSAFRFFLAKPSFTAIAVLTLAVGIGGNTAIFAAVDALLIRPLPVGDGDRLVHGYALREGFDPFGTSLLEYAEYRGSPVLASSGVSSRRFLTLVGHDEPERFPAAAVSAGYLATFGVAPIAGRTFADEDDRPGAAPVALIGYDMWQRRFGGAPMVGTSIAFDDGPCTVIGIMPRGFDMPSEAALWIPLRIDVAAAPMTDRTPTSYGMVARLAPGVSLAQADGALKQIARRLETEYPQIRRGWSYTLISLRQQLLGDFAGRNRQALLSLEAAVGFLLLICCANVANLLLVRGVSREREIAVRLALGASRRQIVRQMLVESALLAVAGGAAGLLLALWLVPVLAALNPIRAGALALFLSDFAIDGHVAAFAAAISMSTGVLFGIGPALKMGGRRDVMASLGHREQAGGGASRRVLAGLVVVEIAVAVTLLVNGGLIVQSFSRLQRVDLGFNPDHLLTMQVTLPPARSATHGDRARFVEALAERVRQVPGVTAAGITTNKPLDHQSFDSVFTVEGRPPVNPADVPITAHRMVTPDYLRTLGVRLVKGRLLEEGDRDSTAPIVVISEELARQTWPNEDPIGRHIRRGRPATVNPWMTVVGVVADVKEDRFNFRIARPAWYLPYAQLSSQTPVTIVVRTDRDAVSVAHGVRAALHAVDPGLAASRMLTMNEEVDDLLVTERFTAMLMSVLAGVGLFLAIGGLYCVIAYSVSRRAAEIGLRMALGARRSDVLRLVTGQGVQLVAIGLAAGCVAARIVSASLSDTLYEVRPNDVATYAVVAVVLAIVAAAACYVPSRRAMRVDPLVALRID